MSRGLVIGYGNPLRGDDGVGWDAALALRGTAADLRVLTRQQLTPELALDVSQAECVVFIDAAVDAPPGEVRLREVLAAETAPGVSLTHHCDPGLLLALAERVYGRRPAAGWLITVGAARLDCEECLSAPVREALPAVTALALRCIRELEAIETVAVPA